MEKRYVVGEAIVHCQYGESLQLRVPEDRHISAEGQLMANETDYDGISFGRKGFGTCHSPYRSEGAMQEYHSLLQQAGGKSLHQIPVAQMGCPCVFEPGASWLEVKESVYIGQSRALMEDSWTFCASGLGCITILDSGQNENPVYQLREKLKQLKAVVDAYVTEKGLSEAKRNELLNSVVLWNGYDSLPWSTRISQEVWDFGIYMEQKEPSLSNYFERGIYLYDEQTEAQIDVSYLAGISIALKQPNTSRWDLVRETLVFDTGAYNGYLEACRQPPGENALEAMERFLEGYTEADYDGKGRYTAYLEMSQNDRSIYNGLYSMENQWDGSSISPISFGEPESLSGDEWLRVRWGQWSQEQKDGWILNDRMSYVAGEELSEALIGRIYKDAGRERPKWE